MNLYQCTYCGHKQSGDNIVCPGCRHMFGRDVNLLLYAEPIPLEQMDVFKPEWALCGCGNHLNLISRDPYEQHRIWEEKELSKCQPTSR